MNKRIKGESECEGLNVELMESNGVDLVDLMKLLQSSAPGTHRLLRLPHAALPPSTPCIPLFRGFPTGLSFCGLYLRYFLRFLASSLRITCPHHLNLLLSLYLSITMFLSDLTLSESFSFILTNASKHINLFRISFT